MKKKKRHILLVTMFMAFLTAALFMPGPLCTGPLEPPPDAFESGTPVPTMHSLEDIYHSMTGVPYIPECHKYPRPRFLDNGNESVTDCNTGIVWDKKIDRFYADGKTVYNWYQASGIADSTYNPLSNFKNPCGFLNHPSGHFWRLPTINELLSVLDLNYDSPALSNAAGTGKWSPSDPFDYNLTGHQHANVFWTSNTYPEPVSGYDAAYGGAVWQGMWIPLVKIHPHGNVWCVMIEGL